MPTALAATDMRRPDVISATGRASGEAARPSGAIRRAFCYTGLRQIRFPKHNFRCLISRLTFPTPLAR